MSEEFDEFEELEIDLDDPDMISSSNDETPREVKSKSPSSAKKISVFFQSTVGPSQRQEKMLISTEAPVNDLKYTLSQIFGLPAEEFHVSYAGRTLDPDDVVSNYDIEEGDTLLLIPVSVAGSHSIVC